jgi:uncharacterized protein YjiS (DUF1127 family)
MSIIDLAAHADGGLAWIRSAVSTWRNRARERQALAAMDDRTLRDLGLTRCEIAAEIGRWRWRT